MRTRLFQVLTAAVLIILPFAALGADDKASTAAQTPAQNLQYVPPPTLCRGAIPAVAQTPAQNLQYVPPPAGVNIDPGFSPPLYTPVQATPSAPAQPTLQEMVAELKTLREKEKKLTEAIREKIKVQRKTIDDAERDLNGDKQENSCSTPSAVFWK